MAKKLTQKNFEKSLEKKYKSKVFHLEDSTGELWDITVDYEMNPAKVPYASQELLVLVGKLVDENVDISELDSATLGQTLTFYVIFKYFTDLEFKEFDTAEETITSCAEFLTLLVTMGLIDQIIGCFNQQRLHDVSAQIVDIFKDMANDSIKNIDALIKAKEKLDSEQNVPENDFEEDTVDEVLEDELEDEAG